jgi:uncharacterized protein YybS (DUF2232 family)
VAEGLGILLYAYVGQLVAVPFVIGAVLLRRLRHPVSVESGLRTRTVWISLAVFALSIMADAWFLFASTKSLEFIRQTALFEVGSLCVAFRLSLIGRGSGRIVIPIMSVLFTVPWLPFILT